MRNTARCATGHDRPESAVTIAGIRTKRLERLMKVESMLNQDIPQKTIAEILNVHAATICRDVSKIEMANARAARANANPNPNPKCSDARPN